MIETAPLLIRADAGGTLGIGHVMRMIALAQAWQDRGGIVVMAAGQCPEALVSRLQEEAIGFENLGALELGGSEDARKVIELGKSLQAPWVVIDGYHFGTTYQQALKDGGFRVLAMDDYGHCDDWRVDLVLNQNLDASENYLATASDTRFLTGTRFAMLRREFRKHHQDADKEPSERLRILMTFGGVDPTGAGLKVLQSLNALSAASLDLKILAGPANPNTDLLRDEACDSRHHIELIPATHDMPALFRWANRVISAGGSTCYEWMFFELPGWITSVAENQNQIVRAMLEGNLAAGVQDLAEIPQAELAASLAEWLADPCPPVAGVIDGWGAKRVAASISETPCWIRPADPTIDARFLFELVNEPWFPSADRPTQAISWDTHLARLQRNCNAPRNSLLIIETLEDGPIGQIRFHEHAEGVWEVSTSIQSSRRRDGLASTALSLSILELSAEIKVNTLLALMHRDSNASQKLFASLGFTQVSEKEGIETWIKHLAII